MIGFSQTMMWEETPEFQQHVDGDRWQLRFRSGGNLDVWADPDADAWHSPIQTTCQGSAVVCSRCVANADAPDRVILTITLLDYESSVAVWAQKIRAVIATIRLHHPQVRQIVLQPVVGGPSHAVCPFPGNPVGVRASYNHPYIDQAIAQVVGDSPDLVAGASPEVFACADYSDDAGHLVESARGPIGNALGVYYGD